MREVCLASKKNLAVSRRVRQLRRQSAREEDEEEQMERIQVPAAEDPVGPLPAAPPGLRKELLPQS